MIKYASKLQKKTTPFSFKVPRVGVYLVSGESHEVMSNLTTNKSKISFSVLTKSIVEEIQIENEVFREFWFFLKIQIFRFKFKSVIFTMLHAYFIDMQSKEEEEGK